MISVIMPVFNVEEILLRKSIESVLKQDRQNLELLLIDDGSTDSSGLVCDEYARKDARIKVYHTENKGVSAARNLGLDKAVGSFVFFVDADDFIAPNCLSKMYAVLEETCSDVVLCAAVHVEETNMINTGVAEHSENIIILNQRDAVESLCYMAKPYDGYEFGGVWGCLYKREVLEQERFNERMTIGEDFAFKFQVFQRINSVACLEEKLYYYIIRNSSAMRNGFDPRKISAVEELGKFIQSQKIKKEYVPDYKSRAVNIAIVILFMIPAEKEFFKYRDHIQCFIKENRCEVLRNKKTRKKVKLALMLSYLGFGFSQKLFAVAR